MASYYILLSLHMLVRVNAVEQPTRPACPISSGSKNRCYSPSTSSSSRIRRADRHTDGEGRHQLERTRSGCSSASPPWQLLVAGSGQLARSPGGNRKGVRTWSAASHVSVGACAIHWAPRRRQPTDRRQLRMGSRPSGPYNQSNGRQPRQHTDRKQTPGRAVVIPPALSRCKSQRRCPAERAAEQTHQRHPHEASGHNRNHCSASEAVTLRFDVDRHLVAEINRRRSEGTEGLRAKRRRSARGPLRAPTAAASPRCVAWGPAT